MAGDCFIRIDGVVGEAQDKEFAGNIDVLGWSWGVTWSENRAMSNINARGGSADVRAFQFTHDIDRASAPLLQRCTRGTVLRDAVLTMRRAGGSKAQTYLQVTFRGVQIASVDLVFDNSRPMPLERVQFSFESVSFDYTMQSETGADRTGRHTFAWSMAGQ